MEKNLEFLNFKVEISDPGSCNDNQTVTVKMSSSYNIFKMSTARISSKYAMESPINGTLI